MKTKIVFAQEKDIPEILQFIRDLAEFEKLSHEVKATEETLRATLFGERKIAEVIFLEHEGQRAGIALFFHNYSTFLAKPGIYLEDLYVLPKFRGQGFGKMLLSYLARIAVERGCGRLEWSVLNWNKEAIAFYKSLGAQSMTEWTVQRIAGNDLSKLAGVSE